MQKISLKRQNKELSKPKKQLEVLANGPFKNGDLPTFKSQLIKRHQFPLKPSKLEILQINVGYMCNQVCAHCHVDAGPDRKEIMTKKTLQQCLDVLKISGVHTLDLTGGAPEMNPHFRWFVEEASKIGVQDFIVRSNLTILMAHKKYEDLPAFFKTHNIHVVSSMPHWTQGKTDKQRGEGVFNRSIEALKRLNNVGYGLLGSKNKLDLVYNPSGAFLPGDQKSLELDFKKALYNNFGIEFNNLLALTNLPISRFLDYLIASQNYEDYMYNLVAAFNPKTLDNIMCKNTLSVSWDGYLYDCDFNQMLGLKIKNPISHIRDFNTKDLMERQIQISQHCYGCTAGAGSSCQGTVV